MTPATFTLAPMQAITDAPVREVLTALGGIDACVTGFVRVTHYPMGANMILRECPELHADGCTRSGVPVHVQLLGSNVSALAATARTAADLGASVIDINFGCPVRRVNQSDGGAALLRTPDRITPILRAVRDALPPNVALSAKVRLGWDSTELVETILNAVELGGADWVTVHARTKIQMYEGRADWKALHQARNCVSIPVVANGDIESPEDLAKCAELSGCDAFMIGRGALRRPEAFLRLRGLAYKDSQQFRAAVLLEFVSACLRHGMTPHATLVRTKAWCRYMAEASPVLAELFEALKHDEELAQAEARLGRIAGAGGSVG